MSTSSAGPYTKADSHVVGQVKKQKKRHLNQTYWSEKITAVQSGLSLATRFQFLCKHGDFSVAYSTAVQRWLEYYASDDGYVAFRKRWGLTFALGDPMANPADRAKLIGQFIQQHPRPSFVHISLQTAQILHELGFYVNEMGVDSILDLDEFDFQGKDKEWLRYAGNWTRRRGFEIQECDTEEIRDDAVELSEAWRLTRTIKRKEVRFVNRPIMIRNERDVRKFYMLDDARNLVAFVFFDPLYSGGRIVGYVPSIKRRHPDAPSYVEPALMKHSIEVFKQEGRQLLRLGLSPMADIQNDRFRANPLLGWMTRQYAKSKLVNRYLYNFRGHTEYKRRFRGVEEKIYYASPVMLTNAFRSLTLCGLCGAF